MPTLVEEKLIEIKFTLDMYYALADTPENTIKKIDQILNPITKFDNNQQRLLEWMENAGQVTQPFLTIRRAIEHGGLFPSTGISVAKQYEVLLAFAKRGLNREMGNN